MATKQITMTLLLMELKRTNARIEKALASSVFVAQQYRNNGEKQADVDANAAKLKANFQSIKALFKNRAKYEAMKAHVNATNTIDVAGKQYTVIDAIKRNACIGDEKMFIQDLKSQYRNTVSDIEKNNIKVKEYAETNAGRLYGDKDNNDSSAVTSFVDAYITKWERCILDPNDLGNCIDIMEKELEDFEDQVDAALSAFNATTIVEIELED